MAATTWRCLQKLKFYYSVGRFLLQDISQRLPRLPPSVPELPVVVDERFGCKDCVELKQLEEENVLENSFLFAAPKKRVSHHKKRLKMTHKWLKNRTNYTTCQYCGNVRLLHTLCEVCLEKTLRKTADMRRKKDEKRRESLRCESNDPTNKK